MLHGTETVMTRHGPRNAYGPQVANEPVVTRHGPQDAHGPQDVGYQARPTRRSQPTRRWLQGTAHETLATWYCYWPQVMTHEAAVTRYAPRDACLRGSPCDSGLKPPSQRTYHRSKQLLESEAGSPMHLPCVGLMVLPISCGASCMLL